MPNSIKLKKQKLSRLLSKLRIKNLLSKVPILSVILFWRIYKMNKIVNKILLAGDELLFEIHLKRPGFTCSAYGPYKKTKKEQKNLKEQEKYIHDTFIKTN